MKIFRNADTNSSLFGYNVRIRKIDINCDNYRISVSLFTTN